MPISWLNHKPHAIAVYASWSALPSAHATLATGRPATVLPGPVLHRLDCTSFRWRLRKSRLVQRVQWQLMEWSGRTPAPPERDVGTGCRLKEHSHVQQISCDRCHDGHRHRKELAPRRWYR